jgi:hypothetical protein
MTAVALGRAPRQTDLLRSTVDYCQGRVAPDSIYAILHRECFALFPDAMFADLFTDVGRRSVPPMIVAVVMVLQRVEGCSDREAVDRFAFDARWKYAAGGLDFDYPGFVHTVLVDMRARLARSDRPERIFQVVLDVAREAGLVGRRRVLDSTPIYDAVATMDTITLVRSAVRSLLRVAGPGLAAELRAVIGSGDDYASTAKPQIDWDDQVAREALIDSRTRDALGLLAVLDGRQLDDRVGPAAELLVSVVGQDINDDDGVFRIARRVASDRVISTVDPDARHGHKTQARGFDGYKGHIAIDPDSEIITATTATPANSGDAEVVDDLLADILPAQAEPEPEAGAGAGAAVYGDAAYGAGELLARLEQAKIHNGLKVQPPSSVKGHFSKDHFGIELDTQTVTCPAGITATIRPLTHQHHAGIAEFGTPCATCPLASQCTSAKAGRTITIGHYETQLAAGRARQTDPIWKADYQATRPKVERKIGHLMRRRHGARHARVRGLTKVAADFSLLAAAVNLARLGRLGISHQAGRWSLAPA